MNKYKNLLLENTHIRENFISPRNSMFIPKIPIRDRFLHGNTIKSKLDSIWNEHDSRSVISLNTKQGIYFEFKGKINYDLNTKSLENIRQGIRLLNIKNELIDSDHQVTSATVFVPHKSRGYFIKKVEQYLGSVTDKGNPKNKTLIESIENVREAIIESFWVGNLTDVPKDDKNWCEIWMYTDGIDEFDIKLVKEELVAYCNSREIEYKDSYVYFPERVVTLVNVNEEDIKTLINQFSYIAEIRRAPKVPTYYFDLDYTVKKNIADDLISRISHDNSNDVSICLFDTGINNSNPLIEKFLDDKDRHTYNPIWGVSDTIGHGTKMAGLAIFFNLESLIQSGSQQIINHVIESVKILSPKNDNKEELYGAITNQSFSLPEIEAPQRKRVYCMAVTAPEFNTFDGSPTSWSGEIDNLAYGVNDAIKRLIILSSGNVSTTELELLGFPQANLNHSIENPAQAWNAISVGAYAGKTNIKDPFLSNFYPTARHGDLSPWSSTSDLWDDSWPIKPEIVCDGGNVATDGKEYTDSFDLSLLSTSKDPNKIFDVISSTSSASAQAAFLAAKLYDSYPEYWPETVRAIIIHSAQWTDEMLDYLPNNPKKGDYKKLLRMVGYGIPNLERAIWTFENKVNMIIQNEIQPYIKKNNDIKLNEMHLHDVPWPKDILNKLSSRDMDIIVRVTLSYFIEPGPGEVGWKSRYKYPSAALRFDMNNASETKTEFMQRVNKDQRDSELNLNYQNDASRWLLGTNLRHKGSIHSDVWKGTPSELSEANLVAVYPVGGWWKERKHLNQYNNKLRYSLIISIESPEEVIDLYTPIITEIQNRIKVGVKVKT